MILTNIQKIFLVLILVFILIFIGYSTIAGDGLDVAESDTQASTVSVNGGDILVLVDEFRKVTINKTLFESTLFKSLRDYTTPLTPEAQGRPNPFAPIGFDNFSTTQNSTSTNR